MTYAELSRMDDLSLARHGWRRNERGGLTRLKSGETPAPRKTWGIVGLVKGFLGGAAPPQIAAARLTICRACRAKDSAGKRLYRRREGDAYCGEPRLGKLSAIRRDEARDGCGCELGFKTSRSESACPLGKWKALSERDAPPLKMYDPSAPEPTVPPPEPNLAEAIVVGESKPCGCGKKPTVSNGRGKS